MMKKTLLLSVFAMLLAFVGCEKNPAGDVLSVKVEAGDATAESVKFTVAPEHAEKCAFLCLTADQLIPSAADILAQGTQVDPSEKTQQHVKGLQPETTYSIIAAVQSGEETAVSEVVKMTTLKAEDPNNPENPEDPENPENPEDPENPENPEDPEKNVNVALKLISVTSDAVTVNVTTANADECRYVCVKVDAQQPSDEDVLANGEEANVMETRNYTVEGLEMSTEYRFIAVAKAGEKLVRQELPFKTKGDWKTGEDWDLTYDSLSFLNLYHDRGNAAKIQLWIKDKTTGHIITLEMISESDKYFSKGQYNWGNEQVAFTLTPASNCQYDDVTTGAGIFIDYIDGKAFVEVVDGKYKITFQCTGEDEKVYGGVYTGLIKGLELPPME